MSQNGVVRVYGKPNQPELLIPILSSGQAGPPSPAFPRRLLGSRLLTESLTNRCSATGGHSGPQPGLWSLGRDAASVRRRQRADVTGRVLEEPGAAVRGRWAARRLQGSIPGPAPRSSAPPPAKSAAGAATEPLSPGQPRAAGPEPPDEVGWVSRHPI